MHLMNLKSSPLLGYPADRVLACPAQDPNVHLKNLKPSPPASAIVDRCIECGFCESNCPSRDITLTPRQRITTWREISRLQTIEGRSPAEQQRCAPALLLRRECAVCACRCPAVCG